MTKESQYQNNLEYVGDDNAAVTADVKIFMSSDWYEYVYMYSHIKMESFTLSYNNGFNDNVDDNDVYDDDDDDDCDDEIE